MQQSEDSLYWDTLTFNTKFLLLRVARRMYEWNGVHLMWHGMCFPVVVYLRKMCTVVQVHWTLAHGLELAHLMYLVAFVAYSDSAESNFIFEIRFPDSSVAKKPLKMWPTECKLPQHECYAYALILEIPISTGSGFFRIIIVITNKKCKCIHDNVCNCWTALLFSIFHVTFLFLLWSCCFVCVNINEKRIWGPWLKFI